MPDGPWTNEPDEHRWTHNGIECQLKRNSQHAWCGYAQVPKDHFLFGKGYSKGLPELSKALDARMNEPLGESPSLAVMLACITGVVEASPEMVLKVHGGVTYAGECGEPGTWWFGFDCSHCDDLSPRMLQYGLSSSGAVYRTFEYAKSETEKLAEALKDLVRGEVSNDGK